MNTTVPDFPEDFNHNSLNNDTPLPDLDDLLTPVIVMLSPYGVRGVIALRHVETLERLGWVREVTE